MDISEGFSNESPKFNAANLSIIRLNEELITINYYFKIAETSNIHLEKQEALRFVKSSLRRFFVEISDKLKTVGKINEDKEVEDLFIIIDALPTFIKWQNTEFDGPKSRLNIKVFNQHFALLHSLDKKLRYFADNHGLLNPSQD
jgi:hypothetical protein